MHHQKLCCIYLIFFFFFQALDKKLIKSATMDLLFMLDCTGSMQPYINAAKTRIRTFVKTIGETYPDIPLRIAFIGYRDIRDSERIVTVPFQSDLNIFEGQLGSMCASGGKTLTDLTHALKVASELDWSSAIRVLFHVGDYPCRGYDYHNLPQWELHPPGDPNGYKPEAFVQTLEAKKVKYCFGQLTHHTDKMIGVFNKYMGYDYIMTAPMNDTTMMEVITSSVTSLLCSTLSSSSSTDSSGILISRECTIVEGPPDWSAVLVERALSFSLLKVDSVMSLCDDRAGSEKVLEDFPDPAPVYLKCAEQPFGKGKSKLAYYAQPASPPSQTGFLQKLASHTHTAPQGHGCVLKQSVYSNKSHGSKEKFEEYMAPQRAALFLAETFNEVRPAHTPSVEFVSTRLVQFLARSDRPVFIEEPCIPGPWERFSNNTGYCAPFPTPLGTYHQAVQAFSHWTHHTSEGKLMVVDCQGSFDAARNAFVLTDPAVHSVSLLAYGGTNMGKKGFERFFKTHRCNDTCRALGLPASAAVEIA